jgi:hypothetical protein
MAGGSKPGSKRPATFQGGAKTSGGVKTTRHAGPGRPGKTPAEGNARCSDAAPR